MLNTYRLLCLSMLLGLGACGGGGSSSTPTPPTPPTSNPPPPGSGGPDTQAPSTPVGLTVATVSATSAELNWNAATDDTGVTGYRLYREGSLHDTVASTSSTDSGLLTGVQYCYQVSAMDAAGNESALSSSRCMTPAESWTRHTSGVDMTIEAFTHDGQRYVAVGEAGDDEAVMFSTDGMNWTAEDVNLLDLGDIAWTGNQYLASSDRGNVYTSTDGISWNRRLALANFEDLNALAWSGTMAVTVGENGNLWSSPDGNTWTDRSGATSQWLTDVEWTNGEFVAVGNAGTVLISTDGITWTDKSTGTADNLSAVASNGTNYVVFTITGGFTSPDGNTWTAFSNPGLYRDAHWIAALNEYVVVDVNGKIRTSSDGSTWTDQTDENQFTTLETLFWHNGTLLVGGRFSEVASSTDARTWVTQNSSFDIVRLRWDGVQAIAVGGPNKVAASADGSTWNYHRTGHRDNFQRDVASNGARIVAGGQDFYMSTPALQTQPWPTHQFIGSTRADNGVIWDGTQFVSVGTLGTLRVSSDGITHTAYTGAVTGTTEPLTDLVYDGGHYVAIGYNGAIIRSADLATWNDHSGATTSNLLALAYQNGRFVAVGLNGLILHSTDGINWSTATSGTTNTLYGITWAGDEFIAVGALTTVLGSTDGVTWSPFASAPPLGNYKGVAYTGSRLVIAGSNGLIASYPKP